MKTCTRIGLFAGLLGPWLVSSALAVVVTFSAAPGASQNSYDEGGFRVTSVGDTSFFGDYYGGGNGVIHTHWAAGNYGAVTAVEITKIGGGTFDLNYFILTSNTATGGGAASGTEQAWVRALDAGGNQIGSAVLLPPEDWGFPATQIFLGSDFDAVTRVQFYVTNAVDCFGMDEFYIDEAAPPPNGVPDTGSTMMLLALGLAGLALGARRLR